MYGSGLYFISLQDIFPEQKRTAHTAKTCETSIESACSTNNVGTGKRKLMEKLSQEKTCRLLKRQKKKVPTANATLKKANSAM